jgi:hypothetical protein
VLPPELPRAGDMRRPRSCPTLVTRGAPGADLRREAGAAPELSRAGLLLAVSGYFFLVVSSCPTKHSRIVKKNQRSYRRRCSSALAVVIVSSSTSSAPVPVLRCPVLFNGTNYRDWVPRMRLHMRGLCLWDFLTGELPCPPSPSAPAQPVISEKTTDAEKERLLADYEDRLASYESQFYTYRT